MGMRDWNVLLTIVLAVVLFATGAGIGWSGIEKIISGNSSSIAVPGMLCPGCSDYIHCG